MLKFLLIRPGVTDFDEQGRIKGTLNLPLNDHGIAQVVRTIDELAGQKIGAIYTSPCQCCQQTGELLAKSREMKPKTLKGLQNLNHGLWHGKRVEEVKHQQPKVYRQWQDHPETVCPPEGEPLAEVKQRLETTLAKLIKKHKDGVVALVVPEPLTSVISSLLNASTLGDLWQAKCPGGSWETFQLVPGKLATLPVADAPVPADTVPADPVDDTPAAASRH